MSAKRKSTLEPFTAKRLRPVPSVLRYLHDYEREGNTFNLMRGVIVAEYDELERKLRVERFLRGGARFLDINRAREIARKYEVRHPPRARTVTGFPVKTDTAFENSVFTRVGFKWLNAIATLCGANSLERIPESPLGETAYAYNDHPEEHEFTLEPVGRAAYQGHVFENGLQLGNYEYDEASARSMIVYRVESEELADFFYGTAGDEVRAIAKKLGRTVSGLGMDWVKYVAGLKKKDSVITVQDRWHTDFGGSGPETKSYHLQRAARSILSDEFKLTKFKCGDDDDDDDDAEDPVDLQEHVDRLKRRIESTAPRWMTEDQKQERRKRYLINVACGGYYGQWGFKGGGEYKYVNISDMEQINSGFADLCV